MTFEIRNRIAELDDARHLYRDATELGGFAVHRCGVNLVDGIVLGYDAIRVVEAFIGRRPEWIEVAKATGDQNAYTLLIGGDLGPPQYDGVIWQALPVDDVGMHARRFSAPYLGIGLIADPRKKAISVKQRASLVWLLGALARACTRDPYRSIRGHGEIDGAHDGTKAVGRHNACPGDLLAMNELRDDVAQAMGWPKETWDVDQARGELEAAGLVWSLRP